MVEVWMVHLVRAQLRPHPYSHPPWINAFCLPIGSSHPKREDARKEGLQGQIIASDAHCSVGAFASHQ